VNKPYYYEGEFIMFSSGGYDDYMVGGFYKTLKPFSIAYQSHLFKMTRDVNKLRLPFFADQFEKFLLDKGLIGKVEFTEFYQGDFKFKPIFEEDL